MNRLLRPRIWPPFRASSGVGPCDVPFRYASGPIPRYRGTVARWPARLAWARRLAMAGRHTHLSWSRDTNSWNIRAWLP